MPEITRGGKRTSVPVEGGAGGQHSGSTGHNLAENGPPSLRLENLSKASWAAGSKGYSGAEKYLISALDDGNNLILHLGMTGSLRIANVAQPQRPMVRHTFPLDGGRTVGFQ